MANTSERRIDIETVEGVTVARLLERKILDEANIEALGQEMFAMVEQDGHNKIILDFSLVEYLSSAALGKLVTMHKKVQAVGGKVVLCNIQRDIVDVFKITKLDKVLTLCSDLDDALSRF
ncbi:MAG: STAS domain-containing protein [Planctomycetaceae bacterium]|nr:STAS domain-containing protein [Planctomycetaceae bacterium]